jgi:hypothetical protein
MSTNTITVPVVFRKKVYRVTVEQGHTHRTLRDALNAFGREHRDWPCFGDTFRWELSKALMEAGYEIADEPTPPYLHIEEAKP